MVNKVDLPCIGNEMASSRLPKTWSLRVEQIHLCLYTIVGDGQVFHNTHKKGKPNISTIWKEGPRG